MSTNAGPMHPVQGELDAAATTPMLSTPGELLAPVVTAIPSRMSLPRGSVGSDGVRPSRPGWGDWRGGFIWMQHLLFLWAMSPHPLVIFWMVGTL